MLLKRAAVPRRWMLRVTAAVVLVVILASVVTLLISVTTHSGVAPTDPDPVSTPSAQPSISGALVSSPGPNTDDPPTNSGPVDEPDLSVEARTHADLFARAFVTRLLSQDYRRPRSELLAWVQAHSVPSPEPLVMGLIPEASRQTWAVTSVTDVSSAATAVPTEAEWRRLGDLSGHASVDIQRVSEPFAWTAAVAQGRVTDPGVTAREVVAIVTLHTVANGAPNAVSSSVVLDVNLEGPPTRPTWAFVTLVTYTSVPVPSP